MKRRFVSALALVAMLAVTALTSGTLAGQTQSDAAQGKTWTAPRTTDGQPDLQGVWANNAATPIERPKELEGRAVLTDEEVATLKKRAGELFNGDGDAAFGDSVFTAALRDVKGFKSTDTQTGNYNHFWIVDRPIDNRTSLVTDPTDGRIPALTPEAQKRVDAGAEYRKTHPADGPEDLPLTHRCLTFGVPNMFAGYNSYFQIIQSPDHVVLHSEMIHDSRIIPLDNRPHIPSNIQNWLGDSRGRWEGDTLVVETTNFNGKTNFLFNKTNGSLQNLQVIERFTRVGPETLKYDVTLTDLTTWNKPWSATLFWSRSPDQIYEFACHEGNEGLSGALSGARFLEKQAAAESAKKGSN